MIDAAPAGGPRKSVATWEHIINDSRIVSRWNIARCCVSCNASKGAKQLADWIGSPYCKKRGISPETVSEIVKEALRERTACDGSREITAPAAAPPA